MTSEYQLYKKLAKNEFNDICLDNWEMSSKMKVLMNFLDTWHSENMKKPDKVPNKVLIFSQTKKSLNTLEKLAQKNGFQFCRMDGMVPIAQRHQLIKKFNESPEIFIFFLTTRVGGLGINLKSANKVIIFDPDWNPMVDIQATDRALRIGQQREVIIYRLLVDDTVEEKIYHRQIFKKYMSDKILQNPNSQKLFDKNCMSELFEPPRKTINRDRENFMDSYRDQNEVKNEIEFEY